MAKLEALTNEMNVYEEFVPLIPALGDTLALALMIDNSSAKMYEDLAHTTMNYISNVLKVINSQTKSKLNNPSGSRETAFSDAGTDLSSKTVLTDTIKTAMKKFLAKSTNDIIKKKVQDAISLLENVNNKSPVKSPMKTVVVPKEFTSPKLLDVKKNKKKEPSIVNTVMENKEDYVVVNPKNLTENQKEKLQRKRDIPALYQDLSQSQDEFKLTAWKTDSNSQETSLSSKSSKTASNNDALVCTPVSNPRTDNNITNSAPLITAERPTCMKRKPKKFDDSLLLAFKKRRHSYNESQDSQDLQDVEHEITVAQVHTAKDQNEKTEKDQIIEANKIDAIDTTNIVDKTRKTDDVILSSADIIDCDAQKHKEIPESHTEKVVTPTTPISNKATEKSPDKPTTSVEVPSNKDKASEGIEKDLAKKLLEESKELPKTINTQRVVQQKSSVKRKQEKITTPLIKTRKAKLQNAALMTPVTTVIDLNEQTMLTKTSDVENETRKQNTQIDVVSTKKDIAQKETIEHDSQESVIPTDKTEVVSTPKPAENSKKPTKENKSNTDDKVAVTPNTKHKDDPKLSVKKAKKSRIKKERMIDTVKGHLFLKSQSEKRLTRKKIIEAENSGRRKSLAEKLNKSKLEATLKTSKKPKEKKASPINLLIVEESQDKPNSSDVTMDEPPCSEDIIESSQDSKMTTISVKSTKRTPKRLERVDIEITGTQELIEDNEVNLSNNETLENTMTVSSLKSTSLSPNYQPVVALKRLDIESLKTQVLILNSEVNVSNNETLEKTDVELSQNKTDEVDKNVTDLTENMDTEPVVICIILDETEPTPITINSEPIIGPETQKLADAETQPNDPEQFANLGDCEMPQQNVEDEDNFLKLKRPLPTVTSSPSEPILKTCPSPASKRKRVSFHDPPVSRTMSVHKYIESMVRSPQSSAKKRLKRQTRTGLKSPKRLENAFNLDIELSKAVESFAKMTDDTQSTLDVTPVVEIVKTSELNNTDPFYPDLIDCKEPIQVIATELSELFVKELEGKIETIGDLAKVTEFEINNLCIKAPKIQIARKVLTAYATKYTKEFIEMVIEEEFSEPMTVSLMNRTVNVEMQTDAVEISSTEIQTDAATVFLASTQTKSIVMAQTSMQTDDYNTEDIISTCLTKKEDFLEKLTEKLDKESIKTIAEKLSSKSLLDLLIKKSDDTSVFIRLLKRHSKGLPKDKKSSAELSFVQDYLCKRYESRDLILLCSQLLQKT